MEVEEDLDALLLGEEEGIDRRPSMPERQPLSHFGPRQGKTNAVHCCFVTFNHHFLNYNGDYSISNYTSQKLILNHGNSYLYF